MDPKRRKIYIAIIVVSVGAAIGILYWGGIIGGRGSEAAAPTTLVNPTPDAPAQSSSGTSGEKIYPTPAVFPAKTTFDASVLDSSTFQAFKTYTPVTLPQEQLGREDPFKNY